MKNTYLTAEVMPWFVDKTRSTSGFFVGSNSINRKEKGGLYALGIRYYTDLVESTFVKSQMALGISIFGGAFKLEGKEIDNTKGLSLALIGIPPSPNPTRIRTGMDKVSTKGVEINFGLRRNFSKRVSLDYGFSVFKGKTNNGKSSYTLTEINTVLGARITELSYPRITNRIGILPRLMLRVAI